MRTRYRLLCSALALISMGSATAASPSTRFQLQGQLQAAPPAGGDSRFSVKASLLPAAPRPDAQARFVISARLDNSAAKAACPVTDRIFGNGFESP